MKQMKPMVLPTKFDHGPLYHVRPWHREDLPYGLPLMIRDSFFRVHLFHCVVEEIVLRKYIIE